MKKKKEEGNTAFKMEQYQEAYNLYNEALAIDPQNIMTNAKLHFNKATVAAKVLHYMLLKLCLHYLYNIDYHIFNCVLSHMYL